MTVPDDWTDEDFLNYVRHHSRTERSLFHRTHVARLFRLADRPVPEGLQEFVRIDSETADGLLSIVKTRNDGLRTENLG